MKFENASNTSESSAASYERLVRGSAADLSHGLASDRLSALNQVRNDTETAPETELEFLINRGRMSGDMLMALHHDLSVIVDRLSGSVPGEAGEACLKDKRSGLLGFANDQQDQIDWLIRSCGNLVARLQALI